MLSFFVRLNQWFPTTTPGATSAPQKSKIYQQVKVKGWVNLQNLINLFNFLVGAPRTVGWETLA